MHGRNGWLPNGRALSASEAAWTLDEPAFGAPWGELEHEIPYVTITTQLFPLAWWTAPGLRATAVAPAIADPIDLLYRPTSIPFEPSPVPARTTEPELRHVIPEPADPVPVAPDADEPAIHPAPTDLAAPEPQRTRRATRRSAHERRGLVARAVLVAVGLIISLIAVETATRRRP